MTEYGLGYVMLDMALIVALWVAAALNLYLGVANFHRRGADRMFRRFAAVAFIGLAWLYTYRFIQFGLDLPSSPQNNVLMLMLAAGSTGLSVGRIRGRQARRAHSAQMADKSKE